LAAPAADPKIVVFACTWYPLTSADNAGEDGCQYGPSTTIVPVECGGCVTDAAILRAFARGAAGVLVVVCGTGDCHYANGNESCEEVVRETRELMQLSGIARERLRIDLSSEVDGSRFAALVTDFASEIAKLAGDGRDRGRRPSSRQKTRARSKAARRKGSAKAAVRAPAPRASSRKKARSRRRAGSAERPRSRGRAAPPVRRRARRRAAG
jgi:F420-non-reducing hydrogenase iron-sulfur subunit